MCSLRDIHEIDRVLVVRCYSTFFIFVIYKNKKITNLWFTTLKEVIHRKCYIKQMKLELEAVQPIYAQKNNEFWACRMVSYRNVDIFRQDVYGFLCT